jgi:hypothetical protein
VPISSLDVGDLLGDADADQRRRARALAVAARRQLVRAGTQAGDPEPAVGAADRAMHAALREHHHAAAVAPADHVGARDRLLRLVVAHGTFDHRAGHEREVRDRAVGADVDVAGLRRVVGVRHADQQLGPSPR